MFEDRDQGTFGAGTEEVITDEELNSNSQTKAISGDENKNDEEYSDKSSSSEPRSFRSFWEVYDDAAEVELDEEMLMLGVEEPTCYDQAATEDAWPEAMKAEISAIERNKTRKLAELPPGHKTISVKWVYKLKRDANGDVINHKERLVVKGYVQRQGIDFEEVFTPVTRLETVKLLLALAANNEW